jgi:hypothetical protein
MGIPSLFASRLRPDWQMANSRLFQEGFVMVDALLSKIFFPVATSLILLFFRIRGYSHQNERTALFESVIYTYTHKS